VENDLLGFVDAHIVGQIVEPAARPAEVGAVVGGQVGEYLEP